MSQQPTNESLSTAKESLSDSSARVEIGLKVNVLQCCSSFSEALSADVLVSASVCAMSEEDLLQIEHLLKLIVKMLHP
jgi:hypothetical protein